MNVEEQEKRLLDYKWHERRYSKDTCYILSTQGTEEPDMFTKDEVAKRAYDKAEKFRRDQAAQISYAHLSERLDNIKNLMKNLHLPAEKAMEALGIPSADFPKYRSQL